MEEKIKYYIYKVTNKLNGKIYVGQHKMRKKETPREYMGKGIAIQKAYKKYGRENFTKEIIECIEDDEQHKKVSEREIYWIKELNSKYPNGYNISDGGEGGCTKESAQKGAATRKANGSNKLTEETKRKISEANKGKKLTEEHKRHLSEHHHLRKEWQIEHKDGQIELYNGSLTKYCKEHKISANTLRRKSAKGEYVNDIKLVNIDFTKYACLKQYNKYKNVKCYDPIEKKYMLL